MDGVTVSIGDLARAEVGTRRSGSIAFGISAVAGYVNPVTGQVHNAGRANTQTLIGAICFLVGAVLLLPERTEEARAQVTTPAGDSTGAA